MKQVIKALGSVMALTLATAQPAWSQAYPAAPIKVIIPTAPGGLSDPVVRFLSDQFQREFGHPMVMDYRAGGGGVIATQGLARQRRMAIRSFWATSAPSFSLQPSTRRW